MLLRIISKTTLNTHPQYWKTTTQPNCQSTYADKMKYYFSTAVWYLYADKEISSNRLKVKDSFGCAEM